MARFMPYFCHQTLIYSVFQFGWVDVKDRYGSGRPQKCEYCVNVNIEKSI